MTIRSLVIAPNWIGDAVMTEPLIRRLHTRGEEVTVAAVPWVLPVYSSMPHVHDVIDLPFRHGKLQWTARSAMANQIKNRFDRAYVLPFSLKSALMPWLAGITERIGYLGEMRYGLINHRIDNPVNNTQEGERPPMVQLYGALSGESGVENDVPRLEINESLAQATLSAFELQANKFVILVPAAEYGPAKRWPAKYFANFALDLDDEDVVVVLMGGPKDHILCQDIATMIRAHQSKVDCRNFAGELSLMQAIALIASCKAMVGNDTGLMHIAAAFKKDQVAIFGSSSPFHTPPLNANARIVWLKNDLKYHPPLDCAPCFKRVCAYGHTRCLYDITPERILLEYKNLAVNSTDQQASPKES